MVNQPVKRIFQNIFESFDSIPMHSFQSPGQVFSHDAAAVHAISSPCIHMVDVPVTSCSSSSIDGIERTMIALLCDCIQSISHVEL